MSDENETPTYRPATGGDALAMAAVERAAQSLLAEHGVHLGDLDLPDGFEEQQGWTMAFVAELEGRVVGMARLTELTPGLIALDQVSVDPEYGGQGIGREILGVVAAWARGRGYDAVTGTTFRDLMFNGPFYETLGCVEDLCPHPRMLQRRRVEAEMGLDRYGSRFVMRASL